MSTGGAPAGHRSADLCCLRQIRSTPAQISAGSRCARWARSLRSQGCQRRRMMRTAVDAPRATDQATTSRHAAMIARPASARIREVTPDVVELVWASRNTAGYGAASRRLSVRVPPPGAGSRTTVGTGIDLRMHVRPPDAAIEQAHWHADDTPGPSFAWLRDRHVRANSSTQVLDRGSAGESAPVPGRAIGKVRTTFPIACQELMRCGVEIESWLRLLGSNQRPAD